MRNGQLKVCAVVTHDNPRQVAFCSLADELLAHAENRTGMKKIGGGAAFPIASSKSSDRSSRPHKNWVSDSSGDK